MAEIYRDYYKFFGINENASMEEIKKAYREKVKLYHPDQQKGKTEAEIKEAQKKFDIAQKGFTTFSNAETKKIYDLEHKRRNSKTTTYDNTLNNTFDIFQDIFGTRGFKQKPQSFYQEKPQEEPKEVDFSEIIHLEQELEDLEKQLEVLRNEDDILWNQESDLKFQLRRIKDMVEEKAKDIPEYQEAKNYIQKIIERDASVLKRVFISKKEIEIFENKRKFIEATENNIEKELLQKLKEKLKIIQEKKKQKRKEMDATIDKKREIKEKYNSHPLRFQYEMFKREEERKAKQEEQKKNRHAK